MKPLKVVQNASVLYSLTCKCTWCHSGVPFFDHFSTSARQKMARTPHVFKILTSKCASRHSGVQFLDIQSSKSAPPPTCFVHFDLKMCFSLQRRAIFPHLNFQKCSYNGRFCTFLLEMCFSLQRRAIFPHLNIQKCPAAEVF